MNEVRRKRKRRKKSRKGLWITLIVLVVLVGGGYGGFYYISHRDVQAEDIGVEQDFFDFSDFSDINSVVSDPDPAGGQEGGELVEPAENSTNSGTEGQVSDSNGNKDNSNGTKDTVDSSKSGSSEEKLQSIENKYSQVFNKLENTALSKLDTLAENALKDYRTGRSLADLSSTYMSAANKLQDKVDGVFYEVLGQMKSELKEAGFNNDLAKKAETEYKAAIANKKSEMLEKVAKISD